MDSQEESILSELSPEINQKLEIYQEILSILSTISEREIDSTFSSLDSLKIFDKESFMIFVIRKIIIFCEIYPFHIKLYAKLAKLINEKNSSIFKESFLSHLFHRYYFSNDSAESNFVLYTLYCLIKEEIYTNNEIIKKFKTIFRQKYHYSCCNIIFFLYFSPELKQIDITFYEELNEYTTTKINLPEAVSQSIKNYFFNEFQTRLIQNDFELLRKYRDDSHLSENPLFEIIYNDDVEKLREFLANPNKSCNEIIVHSIISPYHEIANNLSLISTAAVFSAVNCFKYLLLNGSKVDDVSSEMGSLAQDTIVGGNIEIIRFAQQNRIDFSGALTTCAFYFRNEIFEWIFEIQGSNVEELIKISPAGSTVFCQASRVGNIEILLKCIEMGVDLNAKDIDSFSLSQAVLGGSDEVVEVLLYLGLHSKNEAIDSKILNEKENDHCNKNEINSNNNQSNSNNGNENELKSNENESYSNNNQPNSNNGNGSKLMSNTNENASDSNNNQSNSNDKNESKLKSKTDENENYSNDGNENELKSNENESYSNNNQPNSNNGNGSKLNSNTDENASNSNNNQSNSNDKNESKLNSDNINSSDSNVIVINKVDEDINDAFDDGYYSSFSQVFPHLNIQFKIDQESIIHSMIGAASEGQLDCIKLFFDHGLVCDISLLACAILNSRYETLSYLFEKADFEVDPNDEKIITMITKSEIIEENEGEKHKNDKTFRIIYQKSILFNHLVMFLTQQNDLKIIHCVFQKLHFDISNRRDMVFVLMSLTYSLDNIDTFGFLFMHLIDKDRLFLLRIISTEFLQIILKRSIYKKEILTFFVDYEKNNDISKLAENIQSSFQIAKSFI